MNAARPWCVVLSCELSAGGVSVKTIGLVIGPLVGALVPVVVRRRGDGAGGGGSGGGGVSIEVAVNGLVITPCP